MLNRMNAVIYTAPWKKHNYVLVFIVFIETLDEVTAIIVQSTFD